METVVVEGIHDQLVEEGLTFRESSGLPRLWAFRSILPGLRGCLRLPRQRVPLLLSRLDGKGSLGVMRKIIKKKDRRVLKNIVLSCDKPFVP